MFEYVIVGEKKYKRTYETSAGRREYIQTQPVRRSVRKIKRLEAYELIKKDFKDFILSGGKPTAANLSPVADKYLHISASVIYKLLDRVEAEIEREKRESVDPPGVDES